MHDPSQAKAIDQWSAACPKRFYIGNAYSNIVINEIMYHPNSQCGGADSTELDYIELYNGGTEAISLADCHLIEGISFNFPLPSLLQPGAFLVLAENSIAFESVYGFTPFGQYTGGLDKDGEKIILVNPFSTIIDAISFNDKNP